jgi:hypothetical protein
VIRIKQLDWIDPEIEALNPNIQHSSEKYAAWRTDETGDNFIIAWGIVPQSLLSDRAYLWSLADPNVVCTCKRALLRHTRRIIGEFHRHYPILFGMSRRETRFLDHLGAVWGDTDSEGFTYFEIRADNV